MIVAVDFDGVLCEDRFPEIGEPNEAMVRAVRALIGRGHEVILWTCRAGDRLTEAVGWCREHGLEFCAVNDNAPSNKAKYSAEYPVPSPKVYADVYVEDHDALWRRAERLHGWDGSKPDAESSVRYELSLMLERGVIDGE